MSAVEDAACVERVLTALAVGNAAALAARIVDGDRLLADIISMAVRGPAEDDGDAIRALYRALLGREADLPGLAGHLRAIASGATCADVAGAILESPEFGATSLAAVLSRARARAAPPGLYARPREIASLDVCHFYHAMDLPGIGMVSGEWDLRSGIDEYLGGIDVRGRRVLDVGVASGFVTFELERRGAEVVAFDLPEEGPWDIVPRADADLDDYAQERRRLLRRLRNGFWLAHRRHGSQVRLIEGRAYDIPPAAGRFEIALMSSILMHLRDPILALEAVARVTDRTIVVAEPLLLSAGEDPVLLFRPAREGLLDTWWAFTPAAIAGMLAMLGFTGCRVAFHQQRTGGGDVVDYFTVVAHRASA